MANVQNVTEDILASSKAIVDLPLTFIAFEKSVHNSRKGYGLRLCIVQPWHCEIAHNIKGLQFIQKSMIAIIALHHTFYGWFWT